MKTLFLLLLAAPVIAATPLSDATDELDRGVTAVSTTTDELTNDVNDLIDKYKLTNAGKCALLVIGNSSTNSMPVYFVPGPIPITALQADVMVGPGVIASSVTAGPEAIARDKGVQSGPIAGGRRFILFGININNLAAGNVANVSFDMSGASAGPHIIALTNFNASNATGADVPMCVTTGVITK